MRIDHRARRIGTIGLSLLLTLMGIMLCGVAIAGPNATPLPDTSSRVSGASARIWIYRDDGPFDSQGRPYVRFNGAIVGISEPQGVLYRDVPPGVYTVTVDSGGMDSNQFATVSVTPGQQVFVKILVSGSWDSGGGGSGQGGSGGGWARDTFYTRLMTPEAGQSEMARLPLYGSS